jgi:thymidylate kinase
VFQLDIGVDKIKSRENFGSEIYEKEEFQQKIKKEYEAFHNHRYWRVIDADKKKDEIHKKIVSELENLMKEYESNDTDEFRKNFYPSSIGEDLLMYQDI